MTARQAIWVTIGAAFWGTQGLAGSTFLIPRPAGVVDTAKSPHAALKAVPISAVTMKDGFWKPRMDANVKASLPKLLELLEQNGVVDNFRRLSGRKQCERRGPLFTDSDLYKWMEAAALALQSGDDPATRKMLDAIIDEVVAAQGKDGYLNTWFQDERAAQRWTRLGSDHELYCAGHLFQAAVAHYRATGSRTLLDPALRYADYICETFGPDKKVQEADGHPEVELALVELYRTTGQRKYLDLAGFLTRKGGLLEREQLTGHAVRQMYLCCGGADFYMETGEKPFLERNIKLWDDLIQSKMYVTGGVGATSHNEAFGPAFDLPNYSSYAETCAGIGNGIWNWRMLLARGDAKYADVLERVLYNGFLSGVSLTGTEYFYVNPMASRGGHRRSPWFGCTCCPPNVERTFAAIPGQLFSTTDAAVYVHLYDACELDWSLGEGRPVKLAVATKYPWEGTVEITVGAPGAYDLMLRIPQWCTSAKAAVNGQAVGTAITPGSYLKLSREWQAGDRVRLELPMTVEALACDERVGENRERVALMRGPVIYCLEGLDNKGVDLEHVSVKLADRRPAMAPKFEPHLLGGVVVLRGAGVQREAQAWGELYRTLTELPESKTHPVELTAIPYYAWCNRESAPMVVWMGMAE